MTIQGMDSVLADAEASDHDIANEVTGTEVEAPQEAETDVDVEAEGGDPERDAHGALHAERNRVRRKYTDTVADFERKLSEVNGGFEKKLSETLAERDRQWEQRFSQFAQQIQPRQEPKPIEPEVVPDIFEDANGFLQHGVKKAIDPINERIAKITEGFSRRMAVKEHGVEKVDAAYAALHQAAISGNRDAVDTVAKIKASDDPYGDLVDWHAKSSVISEFGTDPEAAIQKRLEAALSDPAFLARAAEKLGVKPAQTQKPASQQSLPSLNRVTAAADDDADEEDATEVFNLALRSGVRR
ncbi:MAG: hypothetical protein NT113_07035 [Hyphomicrobiales bacterium]|nr:hypothetical protein [Hyphomicrobiales bacterium]